MSDGNPETSNNQHVHESEPVGSNAERYSSHNNIHFQSSSTPPRRLFSSPPRSMNDDSENGAAESSKYDWVPCNPKPSEEKIEGVVKMDIPNFSNLRSKISTSFHYIGNLPWRLAAKTEKTKRTSDVKFFSVYIDCNPESESTLWSCEAIVEFRLISHRTFAGQHDFSRQFTNKFNFNSNNWGFPSFMEWNEITCPERGFVLNDTVSIEARIVIGKVIGVRTNPSFDFTNLTPNISDMVLIIEKKRVYVSKVYLALHSPVFNAMFFSQFKEREKNEITLEDIQYDEFLELLRVIYPSHKPVNSENVEILLELGDKFEIQYVMNVCEEYLVKTDDFALVTKLVWADQYYLAKLQDSCMRSFKTISEVKSLKMTEEYKNLSDASKAALLEKLLKLVP